MSTTAQHGELDAAALAAAAEPPPAKKKKSEPRPYVVLSRVANVVASPSSATQTWQFVRNTDANTPEEAIEKTAEIMLAASEDKALEVTLVAISAARFKPVPISVEVKTQLKFG